MSPFSIFTVSGVKLLAARAAPIGIFTGTVIAKISGINVNPIRKITTNIGIIIFFVIFYYYFKIIISDLCISICEDGSRPEKLDQTYWFVNQCKKLRKKIIF